MSVCPFLSGSVKLTQLTIRRCRSPLPKNRPRLFLFPPTATTLSRNDPWRRVSPVGCFSEGFKRFWWCKYSPWTRFLPSPAARRGAALSVLGGTKMATQRLGWIRLPSRTPPQAPTSELYHEQPQQSQSESEPESLY